MAEVVNRKVVLVKRPDGMPDLDCFEVVEESLAAPQDGQVLVDVEHISIDAFIRTTLDGASIHGTLAEGATITALGVGRVPIPWTHELVRPSPIIVINCLLFMNCSPAYLNRVVIAVRIILRIP